MKTASDSVERATLRVFSCGCQAKSKRDDLKIIPLIAAKLTKESFAPVLIPFRSSVPAWKRMAKILLVEDDEGIANTIREWLGNDRHGVEWVNNGREGLNRLKFYEFELAILDWQLPDITGPEICREYRNNGGKAPVLILTSRKGSDDKVTGLDSGADDYLVKPVDLKELSARVRALLRRPSALTPSNLKSGPLELDPSTGKVMKRGMEVPLLPKEFALLHFLMRHPNQVFSPDRLISLVWPSTTEVSRDTIKVHIKRLRDKLDDSDRPSFIRSIHGMGYVLELEDDEASSR